MSIVTPTATFAEVMEDLTGISPVPERVTVPWIAETFGVTEATVYSTIHAGDVPAEPVSASARGRRLGWTVNAADAFLMWSRHLAKRRFHAAADEMSSAPVSA